MGCRPELIVMLTYNDHTVENAREIFEECKDSKAKYWGFKEKPLPVEEMKALFDRMRECGKKTVLEVVEYDEDECIKGAEIAVQCGCDIMMGTTFFESVSDYCKEHKIHSQPGFICLRKRVLRAYSYKYEPTIKTSPRWCPLKNTINDKTEE